MVKKYPALNEQAFGVEGSFESPDGREIHEYITQKTRKKIAVGISLENGKPKVDSLVIN